MTQVQLLLYEIEKRGGSITTFDLMKLGISQYQARLKTLRERLAETGFTLTFGKPVQGYKRNFEYRILGPQKQGELFNG